MHDFFVWLTPLSAILCILLSTFLFNHGATIIISHQPHVIKMVMTSKADPTKKKIAPVPNFNLQATN